MYQQEFFRGSLVFPNFFRSRGCVTSPALSATEISKSRSGADNAAQWMLALQGLYLDLGAGFDLTGLTLKIYSLLIARLAPDPSTCCVVRRVIDGDGDGGW